MLVTKFSDEPNFYFSYWRQGLDPVKLSFWMRLRLCYLALFKGQYFEDEIILNEKTANELADWIKENREKEK